MAGDGDAVAAPTRPRGLLGRRGFVGTLLAGAAVGTAAGQALHGGAAAAATDDPATGVVVLAGEGIDPSGAGDSTPGLQALVDAAPEGAALWLPAGRYLVDGLVLRTGQSLSGPSARSYLGESTGGARLQARRPEQTVPVLVVGAFGSVADISVSGNGRAQPAVRPAGNGVVLERVTMLEGSVGYDADYTSAGLLAGCMIHQNGVGIANLVDSMVQTCVINANGGDGVALGPGANDNMLVGNKIEWNDGHGVAAHRALHNVVVGGILDRNGRTGLRLVECSHTAVVGSVLRRNGRLAEGVPADDCHLYQQDCTGLVVTGLTTDDGPDDDDGGYRSPAVAIRAEGGTHLSVTGNDLTGRTSATAIAGSAAGVLGAAQTAPGRRAAELEVPAGGSRSAAFELATPDRGATSYRLHLSSRDRRTGRPALAEALLLVSRDRGDAEVAVSPVVDRIGDGFGGAEARYRVRAAVAPDGARLTVGVDNAGDGDARIGLELL